MNIDKLTDAEAVKLLGAIKRRDRRRKKAREYHQRHAEKINRRRRASYLDDKLRLKELDREREDVGSGSGRDEVQSSGRGWPHEGLRTVDAREE